jgi:hypothetical protein
MPEALARLNELEIVSRALELPAQLNLSGTAFLEGA